MRVLVINSGSSSIKYQLLAMPAGEVIAKGLVEKIGEPQGHLRQESHDSHIELDEPVANHSAGLKRAIQLLTEGEGAPLPSIASISAVGHRVVHGGEHFKDSAVIDDDTIAAIEAHSALAPLHNPPNLLGIKVALELMPDTPQVAVFDTAFHQTLPPHSFTYALPMSLYREHQIRRYGFHGTSHKYVALRTATLLERGLGDLDLITCHLGNGASIAAIAKGKVVDTSMGLTPLEGLVMGTRSGDMDPAIIFHLERKCGMSFSDIEKMLNKKSGLLGLSESSNDVRELSERRLQGDANATLALDVYCYRIKKYIGAYLAALGRLDALVFTAGVGENSPSIRRDICHGLEGLGIAIDDLKNDGAIGVEATISQDISRSKVLVVPTNEERLIATDAYSLAC